MNIAKKLTMVVCGTILSVSAVSAQKAEGSGWLFDAGGAALVPTAQPSAFGGVIGGGYSARDFNILVRSQVLIAEPGVAQKLLLIPTVALEAKFTIVPGFITLLPYINGGVIGSKVKGPDGVLSSQVFTYYAEAGLAADFLLTHEISIVPRLGIASALLYADTNSNNHSGVTASLAIRYTFGRSKALDY